MFLKELRNLKQFTCQFVEAKNIVDIRRADLLKSSHIDSCMEVMTSSKRMDALRCHHREKRAYERNDESMPRQRKQPKTIGVEVTKESEDLIEEREKLEKLTTVQLKAGLKTHGIVAKNKSHASLVEMSFYCKQHLNGC